MLEIKRDGAVEDAVGRSQSLDVSFLPAVCSRGVDMVVETAMRPVEYISTEGGDTTLQRIHLTLPPSKNSSR